MNITLRLTQTMSATLLALSFTALTPTITTALAGDAGVSDRTLYVRRNLVSDQPGRAVIRDRNLVNAWGISFFPGGPFSVSDNGTGVATMYEGDGTKVPLVVTIPPPNGSPPGAKATPTGQVANDTNDFRIGTAAAPAKLIFATEDGTLAAWNSGAKAVLVVDKSASQAVYKGLALGLRGGESFLFATNFHAGKIDVFDRRFRSVTLPSGAFKDPAIPSGYAPFGIANVRGRLIVTYAQQDADKHDDVAGAGHGFVDIFDTQGRLLRRFAARGTLNSPWGVALAPLSFGRFGGDLLIGNFGDGHINIFDLRGLFLGQLGPTAQRPFTIQGLWGLVFGNAARANPNTLYFTAGPNDEKHGLFGSISPSDTLFVSDGP